MAPPQSFANSGLSVLITRTLSRSAGVLFTLIAVITASSGSYTYFSVKQEKAISTDKRDRDARNDEIFSRLVGLQKQIQIDVIQVQQFLSDFSATRGQDGQDDGLANAETFAKQFKQDIAAAKDDAAVFGSADLAEVFANVEDRFPQYYERGVAMAKIYAAEGASAGNKLMPAFDKLSDEMQERLKRTDVELNAVKQRKAAAATLANQQIDALRDHTALTALMSCVITAVACLVGMLAIRKWVVNPLSWITFCFKELAGGNNQFEVHETARADEIGGLARAYDDFRMIVLDATTARAKAREQDELIERERAQSERERAEREAELAAVVRALANGLTQLSNGVLTHRISQAFPPKYELLRSNFNESMEKLRCSLSMVVASAHGITKSASALTQEADDLARRSENQAASLEQTSAALNEVTVAINQTAKSAAAASKVVESTRGEAEASGEGVENAIAAMGAIENSSRQVNQILSVIDEIAFQTNLLALNAGVEAARAGDAGRGFAVVATEVRALAQRSADAAKEIKNLISASGQNVDNGVKLVREAADNLRRIVAQVTNLSTLVQSISTTTHEQASGLQHVNTAVVQMDQITQQNAAMVEKSTEACHNLVSEALALNEMTGNFKVEETHEGEAHSGSTARSKPQSGSTRMVA